MPFVLKNIINRTLLSVYVITMLVVPVVVLFMAVSRSIVPFSDTGWMNTGRLAYVFISIPAYFIYAKMMIKKDFPKENPKALKLFIPLVVTVALYFINKPENTLEMLILDSLPLYLGLNLLFFLGLSKLLFFDDFSIGRFFASIFILGLLFYGAVCLSIIGFQLNMKYAVSKADEYWAITKYISTIILVAIFHYSLFIKMADEGEF